jgi:hypothetical protein
MSDRRTTVLLFLAAAISFALLWILIDTNPF